VSHFILTIKVANASQQDNDVPNQNMFLFTVQYQNKPIHGKPRQAEPELATHGFSQSLKT
jgi:hypothetical protein